MRIYNHFFATFVSLFLLSTCTMLLRAAPIVADISAVKPGPIEVSATTSALTLYWDDATNQRWTAIFALDNKIPLITSISVNGHNVVEKAAPIYRCSTGTRTGGWDAFFDFPPANPQGTNAELYTKLSSHHRDGTYSRRSC